MTSRADFIRAARERLGQPYLASGAQDRGANCLGLWACVLRDVGNEGLAEIAASGAQRARPGGPKDLAAGMTRYLAKVPIAAAQPGDLLVFRDENGSERHLGLLTEAGVVLHADNRRGRVVEHRLPIPRMRAVAAFRLPGLED
jgi:cell wall-associated NlpC family hydrolase